MKANNGSSLLMISAGSRWTPEPLNRWIVPSSGEQTSWPAYRHEVRHPVRPDRHLRDEPWAKEPRWRSISAKDTYKIKIDHPSEDEYEAIFMKVTEANGIPYKRICLTTSSSITIRNMAWNLMPATAWHRGPYHWWCHYYNRTPQWTRNRSTSPGRIILWKCEKGRVKGRGFRASARPPVAERIQRAKWHTERVEDSRAKCKRTEVQKSENTKNSSGFCSRRLQPAFISAAFFRFIRKKLKSIKGNNVWIPASREWRKNKHLRMSSHDLLAAILLEDRDQGVFNFNAKNTKIKKDSRNQRATWFVLNL